MITYLWIQNDFLTKKKNFKKKKLITTSSSDNYYYFVIIINYSISLNLYYIFNNYQPYVLYTTVHIKTCPPNHIQKNLLVKTLIFNINKINTNFFSSIK